ncbi:phenoloxidase-activating enzyme 1-like [Zophobas morio]|uniref:phenoloxidase-activating enzyme 1-like n=1 Tax=Zophobas morio TaxID=2755281 RepID=UPI0030833FD7
MRVKWTSLHTFILAIAIAVFIQKCDFATTTRETIHDIINRSIDTPECNQTLPTEAYCVSIRNCLVLMYEMNATSLRARRCGPRTENTKHPYVCCEKYYISVEALLTGRRRTQKTVTSRRNQEINFETEILSPADEIIRPPRTRTTQTPQTTPANDISEGCGIQDVELRMLGGEPASRKEFPWLSRLLRRDSQGDMIFSCSGSLISSRVVMTAAHCLTSDVLVAIGELHAVSLGEHGTTCDSDADECLLNKRTVVVSSSIVHPQYDKRSRNHDNDIGLVFLRDKVKFTDYILPICLLENRKKTMSEYFVAGWGKTESGALSGVKLKIAIPYFTWEQCANKYNTTRLQLTERQICAGGVEGMDACQGDSGGPLMIRDNDMRWYAAGIVSLGIGCGKRGWPGIYVYVPHYIKWIKENIRRRAS